MVRPGFCGDESLRKFHREPSHSLPAHNGSLRGRAVDSYSYEDNLRVLQKCGMLSDEAPTQAGDGAIWGHANARFHLWHWGAGHRAFRYTESQLLQSATMLAAELQVSGSQRSAFAGAFIFKISKAARTREIGWRHRRQLRLISFFFLLRVLAA